ncbi:hypothetical protein [Amycolatopsis minnesotensis]|uniref:hypothetical protein n=1 Tax=Amycolatopsis minnesotensis TaxID=337894 RepID=UPI0031D7B9B0
MDEDYRDLILNFCTVVTGLAPTRLDVQTIMWRNVRLRGRKRQVVRGFTGCDRLTFDQLQSRADMQMTLLYETVTQLLAERFIAEQRWPDQRSGDPRVRVRYLFLTTKGRMVDVS